MSGSMPFSDSCVVVSVSFPVANGLVVADVRAMLLDDVTDTRVDEQPTQSLLPLCVSVQSLCYDATRREEESKSEAEGEINRARGVHT